MPEVVLASSYGFCSGVRSAVSAARKAAELAREKGIPCYAYGDVVHSRAVMDSLRAAGVRTGYPERGSFVIIRAHGISDPEREALIQDGMIIADATCPVVLANMEKLRRAADPIIIGKASHAEIAALSGSRQCPVIERLEDLRSLVKGEYQAIVQTTLSESLLAELIAEGERLGITISPVTSICKASEIRRQALRELIPSVDAIVIAGDRESANTVELHNIAQASGKPSFLVSDPEEIPSLICYDRVGLSAGASAPDALIEAIQRKIEGE